MSERKTIKVRTFPGATIGDIKFFEIPDLRKNPDKIVFEVGTNDASHAIPKEMFNAIKDLKSFIQKYTPESQIIISTPVSYELIKPMQMTSIKGISNYFRKPN